MGILLEYKQQQVRFLAVLLTVIFPDLIALAGSQSLPQVIAKWTNESYPTSHQSPTMHPSSPGTQNPFIWSVFCNFLYEWGEEGFSYG